MSVTRNLIRSSLFCSRNLPHSRCFERLIPLRPMKCLSFSIVSMVRQPSADTNEGPATISSAWVAALEFGFPQANIAENCKANYPFQYSSLKGNRTRIFHLELGMPSEDINCRFQEIDLDHPPPYIAISYAWGTPAHSRYIRLDGYEFPVTESLYQALRHVQYHAVQDKDFCEAFCHNDGLTIWADAICINQGNNNERNHQVHCMKDIYEKAKGVLVFLGAEEGDTEAAFNTVEKVSNYIDWLCEMHGGNSWGTIINHTPDFFDYLMEEKDTWQALKRLFSHEWFSRSWVVQEATATKYTVFIMGRYRISWGVLCRITSLIMAGFSRNGGLFGDNHPFARMSYALSMVGRAREEKSSLEVEEMLTILRPLEASDLRDKVYAALPLTTDVSARDFRIDYSLPVQAVYTDTAQYLLENLQNLDWLAMSESVRSSIPNLPSWVPDYSSHTPYYGRLADEFVRKRFQPHYAILHYDNWLDMLDHEVDDEDDEEEGLEKDDTQNKAAEGEKQDAEATDPSEWKVCHYPQLADQLVARAHAKLGDVRKVYNACANLEVFCQQEGRIHKSPQISDKRLLVTGLIVDRIKTTGKVANAYNPNDTSVERSWMPANDRAVYLPTGESMQSVFRRCVTVDVICSDNNPVSRNKALDVVEDFHDLSFENLTDFDEDTKYLLGGSHFKRRTYNRAFAYTDRGYMGLVPGNARVGDRVGILLGAQVPHVLRDTEIPNEFTYVGETYMHGLMDGEAAKFIQSGECKIGTIVLV